jgi:hypothetical protein
MLYYMDRRTLYKCLIIPIATTFIIKDPPLVLASQSTPQLVVHRVRSRHSTRLTTPLQIIVGCNGRMCNLCAALFVPSRVLDEWHCARDATKARGVGGSRQDGGCAAWLPRRGSDGAGGRETLLGPFLAIWATAAWNRLSGSDGAVHESDYYEGEMHGNGRLDQRLVSEKRLDLDW